MTYTYTQNINGSNIDWVRFVIGDTDSSDPILQDEEIQSVINSTVSLWQAAYLCAIACASKFLRLADESVGDVSVRYSQRSENFFKLADKLKNELESVGSYIPYCGGISAEDKLNNETSSDIVQPYFKTTT